MEWGLAGLGISPGETCDGSWDEGSGSSRPSFGHGFSHHCLIHALGFRSESARGDWMIGGDGDDFVHIGGRVCLVSRLIRGLREVRSPFE